ncbi:MULTISPECIES: ABC transporter ATP-binding protein [Anaerococcus]|jgi:ABC transporter related protein|uniref:ABC transporter ATP-binding protein n=1 Tax=Anaerococcus nagyae TaxID=1755241 RepID=A0A3E2TFY4_9FIRM|nr:MULTISPECIES: ABC transporter ATP-binding protein [Anaerococcus]MDU3211644.1 ABC transporter ATP-binding protein [Anaerococcus sp.]RGB74894.1 ABC transporter ATP-binding protein [Anaerococcus nagyae]
MLLEVNHLSKKYKTNDFYSLDDVSFGLEKGEILGLIGRNGAGKSTLLKLISKSIKPTNGDVLYLGESLYDKDNRLDDFGILIETVFYPDLTVVENLDFYLDIHNKTQYKENIEPTLELLDLWKRKDDYPSRFSYGMKQRLALSMALVAEPEILLLDEPFVGLDPTGVNKLINILKEWSEDRKVSMIVSSHQLGELETLCNRFIYINQGKLSQSFNNEKNKKLIIKLKKSKQIKNLDDSAIKILDEGKALEIDKSINIDKLNGLLADLASSNCILNISEKADDINRYFES